MEWAAARDAVSSGAESIGLGHGEFPMKELSELLAVSTTLQKLRLYATASLFFPDERDRSLGRLSDLIDGLARNRSLRSLILSNNGLEESEARNLAQALENHPTLSVLNLTDNKIGKLGAAHLATALRGGATVLTHLDLSFNGIDAEGVKSLALALAVNTSLECLNMKGNRGADVGAAALAEALSLNATLKELDYSKNNAKKAGAEAFGRVLGENCALEKLQLNSNQIADVGAHALFAGLKTNSRLKTLSLNDCRLTNLDPLGDSLRLNERLTTLYLNINSIQDLALLSDSLRVNKALAHLEIRENKVGDEAIVALARALETNDALCHLDLSFNANGPTTGWLSMASMMYKNTRLLNLLTGRNVSSEALSAFHRARTRQAANVAILSFAVGCLPKKSVAGFDALSGLGAGRDGDDRVKRIVHALVWELELCPSA